MAVIGVRLCRVTPAMHRGKMRQSRTTCSRRHSGKMLVAMAVEAEAAPVVVRPARVAHAVASVKVTLAAVADQLSRAAAIVRPDPTTRRVVLSQTR